MSEPERPGSPTSTPASAGATGDAARRFAQAFGWAALWQVLGKLLGVAGLSYAFRCLGPDAVGVSGTVIVTAGFLQLVLDFGLDIVAVRHVAAKTVRLEEIAPALFTLRVLLAGGSLLICSAAIPFLLLPVAVRWVWWFGALHLSFLTLGYNWWFQATDRMPLLSLLQNLNTVVTSIVFLLAFRPGQVIGSDLVVTLAVNAAVTVCIWIWVQRCIGAQLYQGASLPLASRLFREARPTWIFNLLYNALINMSLPLCTFFLGDRRAGYFRSAAMLVATLQVFLNYFAMMLNPRIVRWRNAGGEVLRRRLRNLTAALVICSGLCLGAMWPLRELLVDFLWGQAFLPAAVVLPPLVAAKFLALASGLLVWGLWANYREWLAVACCVPPVVVALGLNLRLIPAGGIAAAAWVNFGAEVLLLACCFTALNFVERTRAR